MAYSFVYLVRKNFSLLFCKNIHKILVATRILILASRKRPRPVDVCATLSPFEFSPIVCSNKIVLLKS